MKSAILVGTAIAILVAVATPALAEREPGISGAQACLSDDLVAGVTPQAARGTTFVGIYGGDTAFADGMISGWQVERVYAGDLVPADLVFRTPACEWTNLTPGVRYLFSTAVTALDPADVGAGTPSVTDSLAWEVLADDAVRLAPFDTYDVADYASAGLHEISTLEEALEAVAPGAGQGREPDPATDPGFGCAGPDRVATLEEALGTTFVGRYIGHEKLAGPLSGFRTYWSVERTYAGGPLPEVLTMRSDTCGEPLLEPGKRYLFSTGSDSLMPSTIDSIAWRMGKGEAVRLTPFKGLERSEYGTEVRRLDTLDEVLAVVAPDAGEGQTPLRAADRTPG